MKKQNHRSISPLLVDESNSVTNWQNRVDTFFAAFLEGHGQGLLENQGKDIFIQGSYQLLDWLTDNDIQIEFPQALMAMAQKRPQGQQDEKFHLISLLNGHEINLDFLTEKNRDLGFNIVCRYKNLRMVEAFIKKGLPAIDVINHGFIAAAKNGHKRVLSALSDAAKISDETVKEAILVAAQQGRKKAVSHLLEHLAANQSDNISEYAGNALQKAIENNRLSLINLLVKEEDKWKIAKEVITQAKNAQKLLATRKEVSRMTFGKPDVTAELLKRPFADLNTFLDDPVALDTLLTNAEPLEEAMKQPSSWLSWNFLPSLPSMPRFSFQTQPKPSLPLHEAEFVNMAVEEDKDVKEKEIEDKDNHVEKQNLLEEPKIEGRPRSSHFFKRSILQGEAALLSLYSKIKDLPKRPSQHAYLQGSILGIVSMGICYAMGAGPLAYLFSFLGSTFYSGLIEQRNTFYRKDNQSNDRLTSSKEEQVAPRFKEEDKEVYLLGQNAARSWTAYYKAYTNPNAWKKPAYRMGYMETMDADEQERLRMSN